MDREQMPTFEGLVLKRGKFFKSGFKLRFVTSARSAIGQSVCSVLVATSALRMGAAQVDQARRGRASADLGLSRGQQEEARKVVHPLVSDSGACACAGQAPAHLPSWTFRRAPRPTPHVVIVLRCASNSYEECCALASGHLGPVCCGAPRHLGSAGHRNDVQGRHVRDLRKGLARSPRFHGARNEGGFCPTPPAGALTVPPPAPSPAPHRLLRVAIAAVAGVLCCNHCR